jgi:hypothetical protein
MAIAQASRCNPIARPGYFLNQNNMISRSETP